MRKNFDYCIVNSEPLNMKSILITYYQKILKIFRFRKLFFFPLKIFGEKSSLFNTRWQCLNQTKKDTDYYTTFASIVNTQCDRLKLSELTQDMFKCFIFVQGLTASKDAERGSRLL